MKSTTILAPASTCRPWCTDHENGTPPGRPASPADQLCRRVVRGEAFGEFLITDDRADGLTLRLYNTNLELGDRDALEFIDTVRAALAQARTAVAR